jgi:hypothetical protein
MCFYLLSLYLFGYFAATREHDASNNYKIAIELVHVHKIRFRMNINLPTYATHKSNNQKDISSNNCSFLVKQLTKPLPVFPSPPEDNHRFVFDSGPCRPQLGSAYLEHRTHEENQFV